MTRLISTLFLLAEWLAADDGADDVGDVPGWVMVTLMTAGLVLLIWAFAGEALVDLFNTAIQRVTGGP